MSDSVDSLFLTIDQFVAQLEDEGWPYSTILDTLRDYVELSEEFVHR